MPDERFEELELERSERDIAPVIADQMLIERNRETSIGIGRRTGARGLTASKESIDARDKLLTSERLHDVIVGSALEPADSLQLGVVSREHEHRDVSQIPNPLQRGPAVKFGHRHVKDYEVGRLSVQGS